MGSAKAKAASPAKRTIGVLDLQGGVCEHLEHLQRLGVEGRTVKEASDFEGLAGLILPGGESTCLVRLLRIFGLDTLIKQKFQQGLKLWGTCAGAILLARTLKGEEPHLGLIDIEAERNSFGSQLDSFVCEAMVPRVSPEPIPLTFIRAPRILMAGKDVEVLLRMGGGTFIAAAESPDVLVTVFHPELTGSLAFHRYFAHKCGIEPHEEGRPGDRPWDVTSWTQLAKTK